ncbi:MAG: hypothetical protein HYU71_02425 [Bacteroidetes bacterium]|nr:hypothetical protein [Bacteroidota bacterium]
MNLTQEKVLFHLTGKLSLAQVTPEYWQKLAAEAPYFAPAHFFASTASGNENKGMAPVAKTNLYFTNPLWLQYQLAGMQATTPKEKTEKAVAMVIPSVENVREMMRQIDVSVDNSIETEPAPDDYLEDTDNEEAGAETESKIAGILSNQLADFKKPVEPDAVLDIDAEKKKLHTIDYFASQGIKVDLSAIPQDKLTAHLRKFTDWLKQIKQAQGTPNDLGTTLEMEKAVVETAKNSNETREVLTETMADVLEKQGQVEKAIQLYIKLSFINPEKSSYFAAKIEQLKGI